MWMEGVIFEGFDESKRLKFSHSKKSTGYFSVAGVP